MKTGTKVVVLIGRSKDKQGTIIAKKGHKAGPNEVVVNIIEGPKKVFPKTAVKEIRK